MKEEKRLSMSLEDYLETIYKLQKEVTDVRVTQIANVLDISKPSVNKAVNSLCENGYLTHEHYGSIALTDEGMAIGKMVYDTHKVIKKFLIDFLGVDEKIAEKEACFIEHGMSKSTRKKLKKYMKRHKNH